MNIYNIAYPNKAIKINIQLSTRNLFGKAESINLIDKFSKQSILIRQKIKP